MKYTDIRIDLAVITALYLGFLYLSGRIFLTGSVEVSGNDPTNIGFDVTDYTYNGFLVTLGAPQYLIIGACLVFFIIRLLTYKKYYHLTLLIIAELIKNLLNNSIVPFHQVKFKVLRSYIKKLKKKKKIDLLYIFQRDLLLSYLLMLFGLVVLMKFFFQLSDYSMQGQESSYAEVLQSNTYIKKDDKKLYEVICGKEKCVYSNKNYDYFYTAKNEEVETFKLPTITSFSKNKETKAYLYDFKIGKEFNEYFIQINISPRLEPTPFTYDVKLTTVNDKSQKKIYTPPKNQIVDQMNNINFQKEKNIPYFVYYKVPKDEKIESISLQDIPSIY